MSIDLARERAIRLADVPRLSWLPLRRRGKRLHVATVFRWCQCGIRGHRLEYVQVGGCRVTSEAALQRFFAALTGAPPELSTQTGHDKARRRVNAKLEELGL